MFLGLPTKRKGGLFQIDSDQGNMFHPEKTTLLYFANAPASML